MMGISGGDAAASQRIHVLEAQLAMAEVAVRDVSASSNSRFEAMQGELQALTAALSDQSREWAAKYQEVEEEEGIQARALRDMECVVACCRFALGQLGGLSPRVLNTSQVHPLACCRNRASNCYKLLQ